MSSNVSAAAIAGDHMLVSETGIERMQLLGQVPGSAFLIGGSRRPEGRGSGPTPYELLSASLAACTVMTIRVYADRKGFPLERVQVAVLYKRGSYNQGLGLLEERDRYYRVLFLAGPLDDEQRARILLMADQCPVGKTLGRGADITTTLSPAGSQNLSPAATEYLNDLEAVAAIEDPWIAPL
jgi:putative redox protein